MYAEALNTYQVIVKNKMFSNAGNKDDLTSTTFNCGDYPKAYIKTIIKICQFLNSFRTAKSEYGKYLL